METELCRRSLTEFVKAAWPLIEPATPLLWNWHFDAICSHLQALTEGRIKRLLINVPPGSGKSSLVSVLWPAWEWARDSSTRWMFASYSINLSMRDSVRRRHIFQSDWYRARWGSTFDLLGDQNVKGEFANTKSGSMIATSVGGTVTGRRASRLVIDDPHNVVEGESDTVRQSTLFWLGQSWSTRGDDDARECVIMQRVHEEDVSGRLLTQGNWTHLCIPMEHETSRHCTTSLGWTDPRKESGEVLDDRRWPKDKLEYLKRWLGPYGTAGQLQQSPAPLGGGIIKDAWLRRYRQDGEWIDCGEFRFRPHEHLRFATVDPAITRKDVKVETDPDYFVMAAWCVYSSTRGPVLALLDLVRDRLEGPDQIPKMKAMQDRWNFSVIGVESVAYQLALFQYAIRHGLPVREISNKKDALYRIDTDKLARAYAATPIMADGRFLIPEYAPWLMDFLRELTLFPNAAHDDQVDCVAYAAAIANTIHATLPDDDEVRVVRVEPGVERDADELRSDPLQGFRIPAP